MKFEKYKKTASDELSGKKEHKIYLFAKLLMTLIFLWSGFFWSGVTVLNFYINMTFDSHLATLFLIGSILLLVSLILCWFNAIHSHRHSAVLRCRCGDD